MNKNIVFVAFLLTFLLSPVISVTRNGVTIEKISATNQCLIDCEFEFRMKLDFPYYIEDLSKIRPRFQAYIGENDLYDWNLELKQNVTEQQYVTEYQYVQKELYFSELNYDSYEVIGDSLEGCDFGDENSLSKKYIDFTSANGTDRFTLCYDSYNPIAQMISWEEYALVRELQDVQVEKYVRFNPIGKTIQADKWYYVKIKAKRNASLEKKSVDMIPVLFDQEFPEFDWFNTSWQYRKKLSTVSSNIYDDFNNFTLLVNITDSDLASYAQADGDDIVFTNEDGDVQYSHSIELYDSLSGWLTAWVEVDSILDLTNVDFYMYFGNPDAENQEDPDGTWTDFRNIYHLNSTGNDDAVSGDNLSNSGTSYVLGKIAYANTQGSATNYLYHTNPPTTNTGTVMGWAKGSSLSSKALVCVDNDDGDVQELSVLSLSSTLGIVVTTNIAPGQQCQFRGSAITVDDDDWHFFAFSKYGTGTTTSDFREVYDGVGLTEATAHSTCSGGGFWDKVSSASTFRVGRSESDYVTGLSEEIDELRISTSGFSEEYLITQYYSQNSDLITVGDLEDHLEESGETPTVSSAIQNETIFVDACSNICYNNQTQKSYPDCRCYCATSCDYDETQDDFCNCYSDIDFQNVEIINGTIYKDMTFQFQVIDAVNLTSLSGIKCDLIVYQDDSDIIKYVNDFEKTTPNGYIRSKIYLDDVFQAQNEYNFTFACGHERYSQDVYINSDRNPNRLINIIYTGAKWASWIAVILILIVAVYFLIIRSWFQ